MTLFLDSFTQHPLVTAMGWTLIHFLWQATLVAMSVACILRLVKIKRSQSRYLIACGGMVAMLVLPLTTLCVVWAQTESAHSLSSLRGTIPPTENASISTTQPQLAERKGSLDLKQPKDADTSTKRNSTLVNSKPFEFGDAIPGLVAVWAMGVIVFMIRIGLGLKRIHQWRRHAVPIKDVEILRSFQSLTRKMNCRGAMLLESTSVLVPAVIGWLKPAVLVPSSMVTGLTPDELESILAHELAHVRRYDFLINLLQTVLESMMFYHPAVWWLSRRVRAEREFCCDDLAVSFCRDRQGFVRALLRMEEMRCEHDSLAMAANGGTLVERVRRLLEQSETKAQPSWAPSFVVTCTVLLLFACAISSSGIAADIGEDNENQRSKHAQFENDDEFAITKGEVVKTDSKTGLEKRVFSGIELTCLNKDGANKKIAEMMYSNVLPYTFIPSRLAKQLGAIELGEIDFGKTDPSRRSSGFEGLFDTVEATKKAHQPKLRTLTVNQVREPVNLAKRRVINEKTLDLELKLTEARGKYGEQHPIVLKLKRQLNVAQSELINSDHQRDEHSIVKERVINLELKLAATLDNYGEKHPVSLRLKRELAAAKTMLRDIESIITLLVPYPNESPWTPGHLSTYGMNQTEQHVFKVVRIDRVSLGVGPSFGPINALVSDDANSDFGVLGRDWAQQVRDDKGRSLWFHADGTLHFVAPPGGKKSVNDNMPQQTVTVTSNKAELDGPRKFRPEVTVVAQHDYSAKSRRSKRWVTVDGTKLPVDDGVSHNDQTVYVTLMFDVICTDANDAVTWRMAWGKGTPMWRSIAIVNYEADGKQHKAVELFATQKDKPIFKYLDHKTGKVIEDPFTTAAAPASNPKQNELPKVQIAKTNDKTRQAFVDALAAGRSATEMLRHFHTFAFRSPSLSSSITNMETVLYAISKPQTDGVIIAEEVLLNLPEGSKTRAVFNGENIEITETPEHIEVLITDGKVEWIDPVGVIRSSATVEGSAQQLVVKCSVDSNEVVLRITTRRTDGKDEKSRVKIHVNADSGAPKDEEDPPHGAIRYEIREGDDEVRMKMKWHYSLSRLAQEAETESGKHWKQLVFGDDVDLSGEDDQSRDE